MDDNKFIKTIYINELDELLNFIKGKKDIPDLREDFIFRGISDVNYKLIPSALRQDENTGRFIINDYIDNSKFKIPAALPINLLYEMGLIDKKFYLKNKDEGVYYLDNDSNLLNQNINSIALFNDITFRREVNVLLKFLNYADKTGLKVHTNFRIREQIHSFMDWIAGFNGMLWPNPEYFELISLAQHYGLPTRALDWSYDYKVALYFAVRNILKESDKEKDCVLWAFNYSKFELIGNHMDIKDSFPFRCYRPEYNTNPNIVAQKGLFTFLINDIKDDLDLRSFEEILVEKIENSNSSLVDNTDNDVILYDLDAYSRLVLGNNERIFYRFIIPHSLRSEILKELYLEGYSEEYLFPGYDGVTKSIKNRVKLNELINK